MRQPALIAASVLLAWLLASVLVLDQWAAVTASRAFCLTVLVIGVAVVGVVGAWSRRREAALLLVPFAALLGLIRWADPSPVKPFARFYEAVTPGMAETDVLRELDAAFPEGGQYPRPFVNRLVGPDHLGFILDRTDGRYDAEIVSVDFEAGRVVRKRYLPD